MFPFSFFHAWKTKFPIVVAILLLANCKTDSPDSPDSPTPLPAGFAKGADLSWLTEMEAAGLKFYDKDGVQTECMALMKSLGMNTIRLRVWVNPNPAWNGTADVIAKALRAKNLGMRIMIDFHYSDSWADPGKQIKPSLWTGVYMPELQDSLAAYTVRVLTDLKTAGITPEWVQVGNETNDGLLWPDGRASLNQEQYAMLINAGYEATKSVFPQAKVVLHLSNGWDKSLYDWNLSSLAVWGGRFDVVGMSLYPSRDNWQSYNNLCLANMNAIARNGKEVMLVEAGMPWDDPNTCKAFLADIIQKTASVVNNKGLGVLYWEPQAYANWKGYTLGAFDNSGKPTVALDAFK